MERTLEDHVKCLRDEIDKVGTRIDDKERQSSDLLEQVVETSHNVARQQVAMKIAEERLEASRKFQLVVGPARVADQIFAILF